MNRNDDLRRRVNEFFDTSHRSAEAANIDGNGFMEEVHRINEAFYQEALDATDGPRVAPTWVPPPNDSQQS